MLVGIVGAPNKGKSTLFAALTLNDVKIADYPFTTIDPNFGVAYATTKCVDAELGVKCNARGSSCVDGTRMLPVNIVDVAGLVSGAHEGRGMGNQFLSDLAGADALMLVVDASGKTDSNGNQCSDCDPIDDVGVVEHELSAWIVDILKRHSGELSKSDDGVAALHSVLAGLKVDSKGISAAISKCSLTSNRISWTEQDMFAFATAILKESKPTMIVANKMDAEGSAERIERLRGSLGADKVAGCSAAIEFALRKATRQGVIDYKPGGTSFNIVNNSGLSAEAANALEYMGRFIAARGTGVQELLNGIVFVLSNSIVVYPVEDENRYTDHYGNVLPDAVLMRDGSTAYDLAMTVHTDIANSMLYAVDAKTKMRLPKDYVLKNNDVLRIVTAARHK